MAAWLLGVFVLVLLAGLALIRLGWRGRRVNRDPVCRDCGFNLRAFRLPEMHGVAEPLLTVAPATQSELADVAETHSLTLGARQGSGALSGEGSSSVAVALPITVTCPECGGGLKRAKAVRIGERKRMPLVVGLGILLAVSALSPITFVGSSLLRGTSLAKHLPIGVLLMLSTGDAREVADELQTRILAGGLATDQLQLIATRAVEIQGDWSGAWHPSWGDVYEAAAGVVALPPDIQSRWVRQSMNFSAAPKEAISEGDPLPIRVRCTAYRLGRRATTQLTVTIASIRVDGKEFPFTNSSTWYREKQAHFQAAGAGRGRNFTMASSDLVCEIPALRAGEYECVVKLALNASMSGGSAGPGDVRYLSVPGRFSVRPTSDSITKPLEPTDRQRQSVRKFFAMKEAVFALQSYSTDGSGVIKPNAWQMQIEPDWNSQPECALAMRVVLKEAGGNEIDLGFAMSRTYDEASGRGRSVEIETSLPAGVRLTGPVSVIFRPDLSTAKRGFDLDNFFGEEIRIDELPLKWSSEFFGKPYFATADEAIAHKQAKGLK
ncbi:MAG: hypothetical protein K2Y21_07740 [Phycisphaerales bacterium]|nr:hypothetical protein [Phycisphaerales bacterium]